MSSPKGKTNSFWKTFSKGRSSWENYWNDYNFCIIWTSYLKPILVSATWPSTNFDNQRGSLIKDIDAAGDCWLFATTMKPLIFQHNISANIIINSKNHFLLEFDLTSMQNATEKCHYKELVREPVRLELYFSPPVEPVAGPFVLGKRKSPVEFYKLCIVEKKTKFIIWYCPTLIYSSLLFITRMLQLSLFKLCYNTFQWDICCFCSCESLQRTKTKKYWSSRKLHTFFCFFLSSSKSWKFYFKNN